MQIVFGWNLDGHAYPDTIGNGTAIFNSAVVGPGGFLGLLETRLGLRRPVVQRAVRVAEYMSLLAQGDDGQQFFSASFAADAWATAEHLLDMRDALIAAGWKGQACEELDKICTMARIESFGQVPDGFGERLYAVNAIIESQRKPVLESVQVVGTLSGLPSIWRRTFEGLEKTGTKIIEVVSDGKAEKCDLQILQRALSNCDTSSKAFLSGDGTVVVIDADDEVQASELTAAWLSQRGNLHEVAIVRGADCSALNLACDRYALPAIGNTVRSQFRAILQVLPLAFEIVCRPIDPKKVVEFVTVSGGPMPKWIAEQIVRAVAEAPGIDGVLWNAAWDTCIDRQKEWISRDDPSLQDADCTEQARQRLDEHRIWFQAMVPSFDAPIPGADAVTICERVAHWAAGRASADHNRTLYEIAAQQAKLLRQLILKTGATTIPLTQMRKMLEAVAGYGVSISNEEACDWTLLNHPGQIWNAVPSLLWWGFAQPHWTSPRTGAWTEAEIQTLGRYDVHVETPLERLRRDSFAWRLPILNARKSLVLVKPRMVAGQRATPHPIWDEINSLVDPTSMKSSTLKASKLFASTSIQLSGTDIKCENRSAVALPTRLRTWNVPSTAIRPRKSESYSSIDKLLGCSLAWTLQYSAGMYSSRSLNLPEKQLLLGKLAHAVVSTLHDEKPHWQPAEAETRTTAILHELIPQTAASLLLPGASVQYREAMEAIPRSVAQLIKFLREAKAEVEGCEKNLKVKLNADTDLGGAVDMLIRLPSGSRAVLDFKWSNSPYFFRKRIIDGVALQLAIYSWLAKATDTSPDSQAADSKMPPAGFFMFRQGELFFTRDGVFPAYTLVRKMVRDLDETWKVTLEAYERVLAEVRSGTITATGIIDDTIPIEVFTHPELIKPPCDFCDFSHFCGKRELQ